jgi:biotin carboxyl carrier protein
MKYYVTVGDQVYEISIDHPDRISVDGVELLADMRQVGGGQLYSLLLDHASHEVAMDLEGEQRNTYGVMVSGLRFEVRVQDERSRRLALADRSLRAPEGELAIKAPIPGLVVKTLVSPGQSVAEGETC